VCGLVPHLSGRHWQRRGPEREVTPKMSDNRLFRTSGKGKAERVNESESSVDAALGQTVEIRLTRQNRDTEWKNSSRNRARNSRKQTPVPRSTEGTRPGRVSPMWNVEIPIGSGTNSSSRPTARKAQFPSGGGGPKKRTLAAERQEEPITRQIRRMPTLKGG